MSTYSLPVMQKTAGGARFDAPPAAPNESPDVEHVAAGVNCPRCQSLDTKQTTVRGFADRVAATVGLKHFRCNRCFRRFRTYLRGL